MAEMKISFSMIKQTKASVQVGSESLDEGIYVVRWKLPSGSINKVGWQGEPG